VRFGELWSAIHRGAVGADVIDAQLHTERVDGRTQRLHETALGGLPDGAFVLVEDEPWLVLGDGLRRWTPAGYEGRRPLPVRGLVITPPSLVEVLRAGCGGAVPLLHASAEPYSAAVSTRRSRHGPRVDRAAGGAPRFRSGGSARA
jgi:hypothetical protein